MCDRAFAASLLVWIHVAKKFDCAYWSIMFNKSCGKEAIVQSEYIINNLLFSCEYKSKVFITMKRKATYFFDLHMNIKSDNYPKYKNLFVYIHKTNGIRARTGVISLGFSSDEDAHDARAHDAQDAHDAQM